MMNTITSANEPFVQPHPQRQRIGFFGWVRRTLVGFVVLLVALASVGVLYQAAASARDKAAFPAPGQLVDVGGYTLHIHCIGNGSPTVILEAAADMMSADWGWVQPDVAKQTRVCAYDRAGMGWSDAGPRPRDAQHVTRELHTLLAKANIPGPYVLVGHSAGGLYVRLYAATYPTDVAGVVLIDPGHLDMPSRIPAVQRNMASEARLVSSMRWLSYIGGTRILGIGSANAQGLPPTQAAQASAFYVTPQHWSTVRALIDATPQTYDQLRPVATLGSRPLIILSASSAWFNQHASADEARRVLNALHAELTALSSHSEHRVVDGATHGSLLHDQLHAQATSAAIRHVVNAVRTR